jgi:molybdopterin converting factor small subunit
MTVEVKLFASLRDRFPAKQRGRARLRLGVGATLTDLLDLLAIAPKQAQMVLLNGVQVPRSAGVREGRLLAEGDVVAVFPPVAGG